MVVAETIRVAKNDALIVFVYEHLAAGTSNLFGKNNLSNGPDDLLEIFGDNVGKVLWKEDFESAGRYTSSVVFRLTKC